ncbi:hypothetical protein ACFVVU_21030 [Kitasatospora sp. NPDC057965]|uniref:hypothetical protein n=1 Tax=Kitasatospora sp. NPDC057965 TaxID=3346291 RepID=UPI0036D95AD6
MKPVPDLMVNPVPAADPDLGLWVAERSADGEVFDPGIAAWILSGSTDLARAVRGGEKNAYC